MTDELLIDLWREACRHIELHESIVRMAALVGRQLPADLMLLRRIDPGQAHVETLAVGQIRNGPVPRNVRTSVPEAAMKRIVAWCRTGSVLRSGIRGRDGLLRLLVPDDAHGSVMAGPLVTETGGLGMLVLNARGEPFSPEQEHAMHALLEPFTAAYENHRRLQELLRLREAAEAENRALLTRLKRQEIVEDVIGVNGTLRPVMDRVEQVAPTSAPVLILGETGTGKEVIARAIHARSPRRDGPIVRVNCGAIPAELVDSELFGHEKGSFTGAVSRRKGWFERADGGTLFLDEVGELPLAAQVRLLRILQDGTYERVGGQQTLTADVRILAATHRDMETLVGDGRFREDLWYRISVFPLYLPPLRARREDIPALAEHFARNAGLRLAGTPLRVTDEDLRSLVEYPWPGNVREMAAVVERAAILGGGQRLELAGAMGTKFYAVTARNDAESAPADDTPLSTLDAAMAGHIRRALGATRGRIEGTDGAAHLLGIHPNTLRARMRKLGVDWQTYRSSRPAPPPRA